MTTKTLSRKASTLIVVGLLAATGALAVGAAATSSDTLLPLLRGEPWARERALSQRTVALAVHVGTLDDANRTPAEGALVAVYRPERGDGGHPSARALARDLANRTPIATGTTDADGRVVFDLRRGPHVVVVQYEGMSGHDRIPLPQDTRLSVTFDEAGKAHFEDHARRDLHMHGEVVPLHLRVLRVVEGNLTPVDDYQVQVATLESVGPCWTDEPVKMCMIVHLGSRISNGTMITHVVPVLSELKVFWPFQSYDTRLDLRGPTSVTLVIDEEGNGTFTVRPPEHGGDQT